jgi:hypothetical protein
VLIEGNMNLEEIYMLWAICAPILLFVGWWITKNIPSVHIRMITRSLLIAITCGFGGFGTDSAVVVVPAWALLTPRVDYRGIYGIIVWWILVLAVYYLFYFINKKLKAK